jgi:hypothetical protein
MSKPSPSGAESGTSCAFGSNSATGDGEKLKGVADVRLAGGLVRTVELHWYEAHGIGKKKMKIKKFLA